MAPELAWAFQVKNTFVHLPEYAVDAVGTAQRRSQSEPAHAGRSSCGTAADGRTGRGFPNGNQLQDDCGSCHETEGTTRGSTLASAGSEDHFSGRSSRGSDTESADGDAAAEGCGRESLAAGGRPEVVQASDSKGVTTVSWTVEAERLESSEHKVSSPEFLLAIPGWGWCSFQMLLYAHNRRKVLTFEQAQGQGRVELKCLDALPSAFGRIVSNIKIGMQPPRGWVVHDFSRVAQRSERRADFVALASPGSRTVSVEVQLGPLQPGS